MSNDRTICAVCAWRRDCQKKYWFESSGQRFCADYTRDLSLKEEKKEEEDQDS